MNRRVLVVFAIVCLALACVATAATQAYRTAKWDMSRRGWWRVTATYPVFTGSGPVARAASKGFKADAGNMMKQFIKESGNQKPQRPYDFEVTSQISVVRPEVISGYLEIFVNTWGAHPNHDERALTFGLVKGKVVRLRMRDVLKPGADLSKFVKEVVVPAVNQQKLARGAEAIGSIDLSLVNNFIVSPNGITMLFPAYAIGTYAEGDYFTNLPWSVLGEYVDRSGPLGSLMSAR